MTYKRYLTLIVTILLVSCQSERLRDAQEASEQIPIEAHKSDFHADAIEKSNKGLKPHTDAIKASNKAIRSHSDSLKDYIIELEEEVEEKGSFFRSVVPFIPIIIGVLSIILGRLTSDVGDTVFGAIMFVAGIAIYSYWSFIGMFGIVLMVCLLIMWALISQESKSNKKRVKEMYK